MLRAIITALITLTATSANAALVGRVPLTPGGTDYQAYYDTVLDISWLADANAGAGSIYDDGPSTTDGRMTWASAQAWITSRNTASYLGVSVWRLPTMSQPDPTCSNQTAAGGGLPLQGSGFNCLNGEMEHLFAVTGISASSPGPFSNIAAHIYWSGVDYAPNTANAWAFSFFDGYRHARHKELETFWVWPVLDGDALAPVPVPAAVWLFAGALGALGWVRRRQATIPGRSGYPTKSAPLLR